MAKNIFNQVDYDSIKNRIHQLDSQCLRVWGTMSLPETIEHCSIQFKKALGIIPETAYEGPSIYRTAIGRWLLLYAMPWPKSVATPSQMNMSKNGLAVSTIEVSKKTLLDLLEKVQMQDHFKPHPFFGKMDKKVWGRLMWKHLDHHLRQFGK